MNLPITASAAACGLCHSQQRWVLHHVHLRGIIRRLCTSCVLLSHPLCFCPSCFQVYDIPATATANSNNSAPPHPSKRITCVKCSSISHSQCVSLTPPPSTYLCPPCASPKFSFFDVDLKSDASPNRVLDKKLAVVLLCAARIASASMSKAAVAAREEAVKKSSEASSARKRAREALDNLARVVSKEKAKRMEASSAEVVSGPVGAIDGTKNKLPDRSSAGVVSGPVGAIDGTKTKLPDRSSAGVVKLERSCDVSPNLSSAVDLRHSYSEGFDRFLAENAASRSLNNGASKVVEGEEKKILSTGSGINGIGSTSNQKERLGNVGKVENESELKLPLQNSNGQDDKSSK